MIIASLVTGSSDIPSSDAVGLTRFIVNSPSFHWNTVASPGSAIHADRSASQRSVRSGVRANPRASLAVRNTSFAS